MQCPPIAHFSLSLYYTLHANLKNNDEDKGLQI